MIDVEDLEKVVVDACERLSPHKYIPRLLWLMMLHMFTSFS
jgi:hypothetical protein